MTSARPDCGPGLCPPRARRGAVAVISAFVLTATIGMAALVIDIGVAYVRNTNLQAASDMAALKAGWALPIVPTDDNITIVDQATQAGLLANDFPSDAGTPTLGLFTDTRRIGRAARFDAGAVYACGNQANAVQVASGTTSPIIFGGVLGSYNPFSLGAVSTVTRNTDASFKVGSGLASINSTELPILNTIFAQILLGGSLKLQAVDYGNLINANVGVLDFFNALAIQTNLTAGTYSGLLQHTVSIGQIVSAEITALDQENSVANAGVVSSLTKLAAQSAVTGAPDVTLGQLMDFGAWNDQPAGSSAAPAAVFGTLNVFNLFSLAAQAANGSSVISIYPSGVTIPGLLSFSMKVNVTEPPQPSYDAFAAPCTQITTSQIQASLTLNIGTVTSLPGSPLLTLPVSFSVAQGTATLLSVGCPTSAGGPTTALFGAQSNVGSVSIGSKSAPAAVLGIVAKDWGTAQIGSSAPVTAVFNFPDQQTVMQEQTLQTSSASATVGPGLYTQLTQNLQVLSKTLLAPVVLAAIEPPLSNVLKANGSTPSLLDQVIQAICTAFGVQAGNVTIFADGARCGPPILVQ